MYKMKAKVNCSEISGELRLNYIISMAVSLVTSLSWPQKNDLTFTESQ